MPQLITCTCSEWALPSIGTIIWLEYVEYTIQKWMTKSTYISITLANQLYIFRPIPAKCRIWLVFHAQNGLLNLFKSLFNWKTKAILYTFLNEWCSITYILYTLPAPLRFYGIKILSLYTLISDKQSWITTWASKMSSMPPTKADATIFCFRFSLVAEFTWSMPVGFPLLLAGWNLNNCLAAAEVCLCRDL
jgi:hypothetical protein